MLTKADQDEVHSVVESLDFERLVHAMQGQVQKIALYQELSQTPAWAEVDTHVRDHAVATLRSLATGQMPTREELQFVIDTGVRRARQGVPLEAVLSAYRAGFAAVWSAIRSGSARLGVGATAVMRLGGTAVDYFNVISTTVADAYFAEAQALRAAAVRVGRAIVERMLAGAPQRPDVQLAAHGLDQPTSVLVLVARPRDETDLDGLALRLQATLERVLGHAVLCAVARQQVVAVLGTRDPERARELEAQLASLWSGGELDGTRAGLSMPRAGLSEVPAAFADAERALRHASDDRPFVALTGARLFDDLLARADETTMRLLPSWTHQLVEEGGGQGELCETLMAYVNEELSVARSANRLRVHPNTVRYRLARVETITGKNLRVFDDLLEIVIALRLLSRTA